MGGEPATAHGERNHHGGAEAQRGVEKEVDQMEEENANPSGGLLKTVLRGGIPRSRDLPVDVAAEEAAVSVGERFDVGDEVAVFVGVEEHLAAGAEVLGAVGLGADGEEDGAE